MTETLTSAVAAVQADLPSVGKDKTAIVKGEKSNYKYTYADLAAVSAVILPLLSKHGLAWITKPTLDDSGKFVLRYELRHVSGEEVAGSYPLPTSGRPQEMGSAITYARRYALCAVTGVAPEDDDDNAAVAERSASARASKESVENALKQQIWAEAEKRGWVQADQSFEELAADFTTWSQGGQIEEADQKALKEYLTHLQPKKTMRRGQA